MKNFKLSRLFAAAVFVAVLGLSGCKQIVTQFVDNYIIVAPIDANDALIGDWVDSSGAHYEVTQNAFDNHGTGWQSYAGNNLVVQKISDTAGTIFIQFTRAANSDWTYSTTAPDVGKWYGISYKNLTASGVDISGAYKSGGRSACNTLQEAINEFTIANGYFGTYNTCTK